ncbi:MAG: hypothetical protein ACYC61_19325 [Isosphaeraceae bacterium]
MTQPVGSSPQRRRFLASSLSFFGLALTLGSAALMSGCGDDKSAGQLENKGEITKTPDAQDSMKAYMEQGQKRGNPAASKKK